MVDDFKPQASAHDKLINFWCTLRLKKIAEAKAIRTGRSLSGYLRYLIEQDNE